MTFPAPLVLLLVVLALAVIVVAARAVAPRRDGTERRRLSLGLIAMLALIWGAAISVFGFVATIGEGGPELRGGSVSGGRIFAWMILGGMTLALLGALLGIAALVRRASRRRPGEDS